MPIAKDEIGVLILAAGKGTRMHSKTPKVLQHILEEPILSYPLEAVQKAGFQNIAVLVGYQGEMVESWLSSVHPKVKTIWQQEQLGTGHAVKIAQDFWTKYKHILVLPGDTPLITAPALEDLAARHLTNGSQCSFLSFDIPDPAGYGRVIRNGLSVRIVEERDATADEKKCKEVNSGMYVFSTAELFSVIDKIKSDNNQKEYYLPDALPLIAEAGGRIDAVKASSYVEFMGVNDPLQMAEVASMLRDRILHTAMRNGTKCMDPQSVWIGPHVLLGEDVTLESGIQLWGTTTVGDRSRIGSFSVLRNARIGSDVTLVGSVRVNDSTVLDHASIGPFVFIRENAVLSEHTHVGRFVEIKKSAIGMDSKVPHLSYIGDAEIGTATNIGAGTITCNYDGKKKNKTKIGNHCFIGSDTMLVAPVELKDNTATAAGSVVTQDVPEGALAVGRAKQRNIEGWVFRNHEQKEGGK